MFEKKVGRPTNEMVKKRRIFKASMIALALVVIGSIAGGLTYARYRSEVGSGSSGVDVAKWSIQMKNGSGTLLTDSVPVTITPHESDDIADGKVAPGSQFDVEWQIDATGSEVGVETSFTCLKTGAIDVGQVFSTLGQEIFLGGSVLYTLANKGTYTINGVTKEFDLSTKQENYTITIENGSVFPVTQDYAYPTSPIIIPLSEMEAGRGVVSFKLTATIEEGSDLSGTIDDNTSDKTDMMSVINEAMRGASDFPIKLFAVQNTGTNYLSTISNLDFDFGIKSTTITTTTSSSN